MSAQDLDQILCCPHGCEAERGETCGAATVGPEIRAALSAAGLVMVPREPTTDMLQDGQQAGRKARRASVSGMTIDAQVRADCAVEAAVYRAMIAAAQEARDDAK